MNIEDDITGEQILPIEYHEAVARAHIIEGRLKQKIMELQTFPAGSSRAVVLELLTELFFYAKNKTPTKNFLTLVPQELKGDIEEYYACLLQAEELLPKK